MLIQSTKLTPESAEPTTPTPTPTTLDALESAEPTPTVPGASGVSSDDFASIIASLVGMEVHEVPDEEMVDYEATLERAEVNVVYMSSDYYILRANSVATKFSFAMESVVF